MAVLATLPSCSDQSDTKDSETKKNDGNSVAKKPPSGQDKPEGGKGEGEKPEEGEKGEKSVKSEKGEKGEKGESGESVQGGPEAKGPDGKPVEKGKDEKLEEKGKDVKPGDKDKKDDDKKKDEPVEDPNDPLEAMNFKDFEVGKLMDKVGQWTGKVIIPVNGEVLKQKITIYSTKKMPRSKALKLIYTVLRTKGFVAEEQDDIIFLKPLKDAKLLSVPTIPPDQPLAMIADKEMIVQKFFSLKEYPPGKMKEIIAPLVPEYGYVNADETTKTLIVIDTVANLQRIEGYINQLDVAEEEEMERRIFDIQQGDPTEIAQLLKIIMSAGYPQLDRRSRYNRYSSYNRSRSDRSSSSSTEAVFIPEPTRKWLIVKATAEDMVKIEEWITKLDRKQEVGTDYTVISVEHADVDEIAGEIENMMERMPSSELQPNVQVIDLEQNSTLLVFGSPERRELVAKMVKELDIPPDKFETVHIKLKNAEPEEIKQYVEELFSELSSSRNRRSPYGGYYGGYGGYYGGRRGGNQDEVRVIAYPTLKQVTVIASPHLIDDIKKQIEEWDKPLDVDEVKPLILVLKNSDPVKMANLLSSLFSEQQGRGNDFMSMIFGFGSSRRQTQHEVVGPLYGKLSFEAVPDTKKIIVISQIPEAYRVIREFVEELDRQEIAELPMVVVLKYADPEDLSERLNALLNESGTNATIHLSKRSLSAYGSGATSEKQSGSSSDGGGRNPNANPNAVQPGEYRPWWTSGQRRREEEQPISNIIGQIRFIPDYRSKAILVLCPPEYKESVRTMIEELDKPAKQVMIKATILAIDLKEETSIGVQLANDPTVFGSFTENSLDVINALRYAETFGKVNLSSSMDVSVLIDFLVKNVDANILNEPTLWAKDNEEATFFRGRTIPFIASSQSSPEATSTTQTFDEKNVGVTLRVRPNITPEKAIDMELNLIISRQEPELILGNTATSETNTTTHLIVEDGTTVLLSGILFQQDVSIERKLPFFGDIPLLGELFKHKELLKENSEVMIFLTPYVIENVAEGGVAAEY